MNPRVAAIVWFGALGCTEMESTGAGVADTGTIPTGTPRTGSTTVPTGSTSTGTTPPGTVGVFVAQGHVGRTLISIDGGRTWTEDQSEDDALRCWSDNWLPDCDHRSDSARGLAFGDGWFVATFGWGAPGELRRSRDGVTWEPVTVDSNAAGVAYGQGSFLAGSWLSWRSDDLGETWTNLDWVVDTNIRRTTWLDVDGGRFLLEHDGGLVLSADRGDSWTAPAAPASCGTNTMFSGGFAHGDGVIVGVTYSGTTCRSSDEGATFTAGGDVGAELSSRLLWDGQQFAVWSNGTRHTSPDGQVWTATPLSAPLTLDAVAQSDDGVFVGVAGWYEDQRFYWSTDGLSWTEAAATGGHPIYEIAFGRVALGVD